MKPFEQHGLPRTQPLVLGLSGFSKISAVEGIFLSEDSKNMFAKFTEDQLSMQERLNRILQKHGTNG